MVTCGTKAFEHQRGMVIIADHCRAPILWLMHPSEDNVGVLDVEPGIDRDLFSSKDEVNRDQVSELKRVRRASDCRIAVWFEHENEASQRKGRYNVIRLEAMLLSILTIDYLDFIRAVMHQPDDGAPDKDIIPGGPDVFRRPLRDSTIAVPRIHELIDQAHDVLAGSEQCVSRQAPYRKPATALGYPIRGELGAWPTPHFLTVA